MAVQKPLPLRLTQSHFGSWQPFGNIHTENLLIEGGRNGPKRHDFAKPAATLVGFSHEANCAVDSLAVRVGGIHGVE
jgi:hypothetical protein